MAASLQRILLVEDDPDIQAVTRLALEAVGGFTVGICSCGKQALEEAVGFSPDLILLDVMMPVMDGPTTLKALRELSPLRDTPVIFMTAKVQTHEVENYKQLGAVDVICKPFDPMNLSSTIRTIWATHHA
ncbi:MAG: response regulator [Thermostichus sp. DG_1_6_bins_120]